MVLCQQNKVKNPILMDRIFYFFTASITDPLIECPDTETDFFVMIAQEILWDRITN